MRVAGLKIRGPALAYVLLEDALLILALVGAVLLASAGGDATLQPLAGTALVATTLIVLKLVFLGTGLYEFRRFPRGIDFWRDLAVGLLIFSLCAWVAICSLWHVETNRYFLFVGTFVPGVLMGRLVFASVVRFGPWRRRVLFLGHGPHARRTAEALTKHPEWMHTVVGFVGVAGKTPTGTPIDKHELLGSAAELEQLVTQHRVDEVVVALEDRRQGFPTEPLLRVRLSGTNVIEEARLHEEITGRIPVDDLRPSSLIFADGFERGRLPMALKRIFDVLLSVFGLVVAAPLAIGTAIAIRWDSPGPVFYGQKRVGLGGKEFTLYKFRSMRTDAEADGTPRFASKNDARVTKVGNFLRKSRLDEIPQMWNVLRGDMSFVGPRPERRYFVDQLKESIPYYDLRHMMKPGITGWAQVRYSYGAGELDALRKLRYDLYYVKHLSLLLDLRILCDTVGVMIDGELGR